MTYLRYGIIGLPNVGKSTLFKILTNINVKIANFPFCTIKPNSGFISIKDNRLIKLSKIINPLLVTPTKIKLIDIAGLICGSSKGEGLGCQFLDYIRDNTDIVIHVVRCFKDSSVYHINNKVNPTDDINIINTELILSDLIKCEYIIEKNKKDKSKNNKHNIEFLTLQKCLDHLNTNKMLNTLQLNQEEKNIISFIKFITMKPMIYVANIDISTGYNNNVEVIKNKYKDILIMNICAKMNINNKLNNQILDIKLQQKTEFITKLIEYSYKLLNVCTFFTFNRKELRSYHTSIKSNILKVAKEIHSDFAKKFMKAQIIHFDDFINFNGIIGVKKHGKMFTEGKDYIVQDGDIIKIIIN